MGIPSHPISRIEQYLAGICTALGVDPDPERGDAMKVLYLEETTNAMVARTGDGYATFQEFVDNLGSEDGAYIPAVVNGKIALEVTEGRTGYYNFVTFDGIAGTESGFVGNLVNYEVNEVAEAGLYPMTVTPYTWELTAVELGG